MESLAGARGGRVSGEEIASLAMIAGALVVALLEALAAWLW